MADLRARIADLPFWRFFGYELISREKVLQLLNQELPIQSRTPDRDRSASADRAAREH